MNEYIGVKFHLRTSSASQFSDLIKKSGAKDFKEAGRNALGYFGVIAAAFNDGRDIVEYDPKTSQSKIIDLFGEAAKASLKAEVTWALSRQGGEQLIRETGRNDLSLTFTNAFYIFDRAIDTQKKGLMIASRDPLTMETTPHVLGR